MERDVKIGRKAIISLYSMIGLIIVAFPAYAQDATALKCGIYDAIYKPYATFESNKFDYSLDVQETKCIPPACPSANIDLTLRDKETEAVLSVLTMQYGCSGGSFAHCVAGFSNYPVYNSQKDYDRVSFDIVALASDWVPVNLVDKNAPYALIFPAMDKTFQFTDWDKFTNNIQYFTSEKVSPNAATPNIWILDQCINRK